MFGIGTITGRIAPCTEELFNKAVDDPKVLEICQMISKLKQQALNTGDEKRIKWCNERVSQAKRLLPVITPMATFKDNIRKSANAIESGLNMLDIDHIDNPRVLWDEVKGKMPYKVMLVHVTPSGEGLRIIFVNPEGVTLADAQAKVAKALGVCYDAVTKDYARCSFLVCRDYIIYLDKDIFKAVKKQKAVKVAVAKEEPTTEEQPAVKAKPTSYPSNFKGISYDDIIGLLLMNAGYDTTPSLGERNNALYMLARNLRYVCDFDADFIISKLPDWELPEHEVRATVDSAIKSVRMATMPKVLQTLISKAKPKDEKEEAEAPSVFNDAVKCDGLIGSYVNLYPDYMKNAVYLSVVSCLGTLLTGLRGRSCDGSVLAPNFMLTIGAPQATGKSFMKIIANDILKPIRDEDKRQREEQKKIDKENKKNKDKEDYEEKEFEGVIRVLPSNTSNRILLERLDLAKGKHCVIVAEEIDSITKAEKSGKWSEKSDIYRLAYDNSEWGMDYASENSYKAVVPVYLNLLFSGTPIAVDRFFADLENGLVTRFLFADLPDTYGMKRPRRVFMSAEQQHDNEERLLRLYQQMEHTGTEDGLIWMDTEKMVNDTIEYYDEVQRKMYLGNQEVISRDLARRRYADYCVKMMMIETWLNDGVYTDEIRDRVIAIMEYCTEQLIKKYGKELDNSLSQSVEKINAPVNEKKNVLDLLPDEFTFEMLGDALTSIGNKKGSAGQVAHRLVRGGLIIKKSRGVYEKQK